MRVDAEQNRERILAAARHVLAEAGPGVPMTRIARRAGVAVATLYRRFPSRDDLVAGAYANQWSSCSDSHAAALTDPDPGRALQALIHRLCAYQVHDKGFTAAYVSALITGRGLDQQRADSERVIGTLLARAQAAGTFRADIERADLIVLLAGNAGVVASAGPGDAASASRRYVAHMLRSFVTEATR
ncbi:TetR/AcrR family transcriptional regulator [Micromonospora rubida]|uniref:TetR/AcrR family transcriptional regulator n=1 Tax=Micromonospora rubida TaxID=2697657 RepID=A0ABW7SPP8_9ACTN